MKQNERILVYLVTGFLAVILVVAVFFGRDSSAAVKPRSDDTVRGLGQILDQKPVPGGPAVGGEAGNPASGDPASGNAGAGNPGRGPAGPATTQPNAAGSNAGGNNAGGNNAGGNNAAGSRAGGSGEQGGGSADVMRPPLVASLPVAASARVTQLLGTSRRDRNVRIVRARSGDSLESLVRRWCGVRDPFLDEARSLNEDLTILRVDQEVVVPWADDEVVLAAFEARQPKLLAGPGRPTPASESVSSGPTFQVPGGGADQNRAGNENGGAAAAVATVPYVVQKNDSLWKIAAKRYGNRNAPRMIKQIKQLNGLTSDALQLEQKLILPADS